MKNKNKSQTADPDLNTVERLSLDEFVTGNAKGEVLYVRIKDTPIDGFLSGDVAIVDLAAQPQNADKVLCKIADSYTILAYTDNLKLSAHLRIVARNGKRTDETNAPPGYEVLGVVTHRLETLNRRMI
jgi:hypothetical protein